VETLLYNVFVCVLSKPQKGAEMEGEMKDFAYAVLQWLSDLGYLGVALGLMIEVIPSEIVLAYAGYLVSQKKISLFGALLAGVIGGTIAQLFLYWMGYYGGRPFLEKYGKYLLIHRKHLDQAEQWFQKYGTGVIFSARFIPVVRHAISVPAGISKMPFAKFTFYTMLAMIPWSIFFIYLGIVLGENWQQIHEVSQPYIKPVIGVSVIALVLYFVIKRLRRRKG
jgi:membrane protein DedA with SNARE-associated domain